MNHLPEDVAARIADAHEARRAPDGEPVSLLAYNPTTGAFVGPVDGPSDSVVVIADDWAPGTWTLATVVLDDDGRVILPLERPCSTIAAVKAFLENHESTKERT